jgi:hypothetical protein
MPPAKDSVRTCSAQKKNLKLKKPSMLLRIALLLAFTASTGWALSEENLNQQLDVSPGGKLEVEVDFGTIDVSIGGDNQVLVHAHRKIETNDDAREKEYVSAVPIIVNKDGNTVTVRAVRPKDHAHWSWTGNVNMDADYTVKVPKNFNADLRTRGGSITVNGLAGEVAADTNGGKMKFAQLRGPLDARTSGGSIILDTCNGDLTVATNGGAIDCKSGSGNLDARTSGGSIVVRDFGGDAEVKTSGGKLTLENISGTLSGKTSAGSISVLLPFPVPGDVTLQTSAGSIDVALSEKAAVSVDAKTGMGSIRAEIPMLATKSSDDRLEGTLNGGGKSLVLHASVGSITLRPSTTETAAR